MPPNSKNRLRKRQKQVEVEKNNKREDKEDK